MTTRLCTLVAAIALVCGARPAAAQAVEATRPDAPLQMGPLQLFPTLTLREIGTDSNVYNGQVQREDFMFLTSSKAVKIPNLLVPPDVRNHGYYTA